MNEQAPTKDLTIQDGLRLLGGFAMWSSPKEPQAELRAAARAVLHDRLALIRQLEDMRVAAATAAFERAASEPRAGWQPIETAPKDRDVFFWIVPNEGYTDTSGNPIVSREPPRMLYGRYGRWGSLSKAKLWHEGATPPPEDAPCPHPIESRATSIDGRPWCAECGGFVQ
jgi:hypothetical protein